jgi:hypothetical protein
MKAQTELPKAGSDLRVREAILASLGNYTEIENKEQWRLKRSLGSIEMHHFLNISNKVVLIGVRTEYTAATSLRSTHHIGQCPELLLRPSKLRFVNAIRKDAPIVGGC